MWMQELFEELLGAVADGKSHTSIQVNFSWFHNAFTNTSSGNKSKVQSEIMRLVKRGPAFHLDLFKKFERLTWGSASLTSLYKSLARVSTLSMKDEDNRKPIKTITGQIHLLQVLQMKFALHFL